MENEKKVDTKFDSNDNWFQFDFPDSVEKVDIPDSVENIDNSFVKFDDSLDEQFPFDDFIIEANDAITVQDNLQIDISSSIENRINSSREISLRNQFTTNLIDTIREENFEFGYISRSENIIKEQLEINSLATRNWLNEIFITHYNDEAILIGLLRIIGRFEEGIIFPQGQTLALAALIHENDEIKELGIRAFENWSSQNSVNVLKKIDISQQWLNTYKEQIIIDLEEELCHT